MAMPCSFFEDQYRAIERAVAGFFATEVLSTNKRVQLRVESRSVAVRCADALKRAGFHGLCRKGKTSDRWYIEVSLKY